MSAAAQAVDFTARKPANDPAWDDPELYGQTNPPPFPVDALATWQRDWAVAEAEFTQTPIDLPAVLALACASFAASRGVDIAVRDGWHEPLNIYAAVGLDPGHRKSSAFADATRPLFAYQTTAAAQAMPKVAAYASARRVLEKRIAAAEDAAAKGLPYQGRSAVEAIGDLHQDFADLKEVGVPVLIADDATPEAIAKLLSMNGERLAVFSAEGGGPFEMMSGRYSDKGANLEIWLKCHAGDTHAVARIKREPLFLARPMITMALTVQPSVIAGLADKEGFRGRGLLARFFYSLPESTMGTRNVNAPRVPDAVRAAYGAGLLAMLTRLGEAQRRLTMSEGANLARIEWDTKLEPRLGPDGDLRPIADWASKLTGLVGRIAGTLHCAEHAHADAPPTEVSLETWLRAQAIGEYALAHARQAFDLMGSDEADELAQRVWAWVLRQGKSDFSTYEAKRAAHASPEDIAVAMDRLDRRSLVRARPPAPPKPGKPPSPHYDVNPKAVRR